MRAITSAPVNVSAPSSAVMPEPGSGSQPEEAARAREAILRALAAAPVAKERLRDIKIEGAFAAGETRPISFVVTATGDSGPVRIGGQYFPKDQRVVLSQSSVGEAVPRRMAIANDWPVSGADSPTSLHKMPPSMSKEEVAAALKRDGFRQVAFEANGALYVIQSEDLAGGKRFGLVKPGAEIEIVEGTKDGTKIALKGIIFATDNERSFAMRGASMMLGGLGVMGLAAPLFSAAGEILSVFSGGFFTPVGISGVVPLVGAGLLATGIGLGVMLGKRQKNSVIAAKAIESQQLVNGYARG